MSWVAVPLLALTIACATHRPSEVANVTEASAVEGASASDSDDTPADSGQTSTWPGFRGPDRTGVYRAPIRVSWEGLAPMWKKPVGLGAKRTRTLDM